MKPIQGSMTTLGWFYWEIALIRLRSSKNIDTAVTKSDEDTEWY